MWDWLMGMVEIPRWALYGAFILSGIASGMYHDFMRHLRRRKAMKAARLSFLRQVGTAQGTVVDPVILKLKDD